MRCSKQYQDLLTSKQADQERDSNDNTEDAEVSAAKGSPAGSLPGETPEWPVLKQWSNFDTVQRSLLPVGNPGSLMEGRIVSYRANPQLLFVQRMG